MKILMIAGAFYPKVDGSVTAVANLSEGLSQRGNEVTLLTRGYDVAKDATSWHGVKVERVYQRGFSLAFRIWLAFDQSRRGIRLLKRERFDVIHAHGFTSLLPAILLHLVGKVPVTVTFHGLQRLWNRKWSIGSRWKYSALLPFEGLLARRADLIIAQSEKLKAVLVRLYGLCPEAVKVFPNPVDIDSFPFCEPTRSRTVLFVGTIGTIYGPDILVRAAKRVVQRVPDARFVFIGEGPATPAVQRLAEEEEVTRNVQFVGKVTDKARLHRYYAESRMLVIPFKGEGGYILSLAALESMAVGRPVVIGYDVDSTVGVFREDSNPSDLSERITNLLLLNDEEYSELSKGTRAAVNGFSSAEIARGLENTYVALALSRNYSGRYLSSHMPLRLRTD